MRNKLSYYLREVRKGRRVVILDRGRAVAQLVPLEGKPDDLATRLEELGQEGIVTIPSRSRQEVERIALHRSQVTASRLVSEMRDDP
ncbi:MAG: type II toxin-antitoxin system prevent-host-death family antitoxin [Bradymonadales bacterium]|nr:type II toxin-antitoxin system prevent-host-death family antitoxin [Bradymonadales bacterium]